MEQTAFDLIIDPDFKKYIFPITRKHYSRLESDIISNGCRKPIIIWNKTIIDGFYKYRICKEHNIALNVEKMVFDCKESVIAWICMKQLCRTDLPEETRKYLMGVQYTSEKMASKRKFDYIVLEEKEKSPIELSKYYDDWASSSGHLTAQRIGEVNHVSWNSVYKYSIYAKAVDDIEKQVPEIIPSILSGKYKISHNNLVKLSKMNPQQIKKVAEGLEKDCNRYLKYSNTRQEINDMFQNNAFSTSVKDMPEYDPDADLNSFSLTIPTWTSSINRIIEKVDFNNISTQARNATTSNLYKLCGSISKLIEILKGEI